MLIQDRFISHGNFLFRWRSYVPLALLAIIVIYLLQKPADLCMSAPLTAVALAVSFLGLAIRLYTIGYKNKGTSGRNTKQQVAEALNSKGIYSLVRNPLYLGNFLITWGPVLYTGSWVLSLIFFGFFALHYERIIAAEENFLKGKFGETYVKWAEATPAFFPKWSGFVSNELPFVPFYALYKEKEAILGMAVSFALMNFLIAWELAVWIKVFLLVGVVYYVFFYLVGSVLKKIRRNR